jgi:hypothetical protein
MHGAKEISLLAKYRRDRVFSGTTLFSTFSERLVRKHVMVQHHVGEGHPVFEEEDRLIAESVHSIREYLSKARIKWPIPWATAKTVVVQYVRNAAAERLREMELDDDVEESVMESIAGEDLSGIFPDSWFDS